MTEQLSFTGVVGAIITIQREDVMGFRLVGLVVKASASLHRSV